MFRGIKDVPHPEERPAGASRRSRRRLAAALHGEGTRDVAPMNLSPAESLLVPNAPALVVGLNEAIWLTTDGEVETLGLAQAAKRARAELAMLCHGRAVARRLGVTPFPALDLLELFAFVRPARFCLPTPRGLAAVLGLARPLHLA